MVNDHADQIPIDLEWAAVDRGRKLDTIIFKTHVLHSLAGLLSVQISDLGFTKEDIDLTGVWEWGIRMNSEPEETSFYAVPRVKINLEALLGKSGLEIEEQKMSKLRLSIEDFINQWVTWENREGVEVREVPVQVDVPEPILPYLNTETPMDESMKALLLSAMNVAPRSHPGKIGMPHGFETEVQAARNRMCAWIQNST